METDRWLQSMHNLKSRLWLTEENIIMWEGYLKNQSSSIVIQIPPSVDKVDISFVKRWENSEVGQIQLE